MNYPDPGIQAEYLTVMGSRAYGLNKETSDWDFRGFFMPTRKQILGFLGGPESRGRQVKGQVDVMTWDIRKFFSMASKANPNVLEALFTEPEHHVKQGILADRVLKIRHSFLSEQAKKSFAGYAFSQLGKLRVAQQIDEGNWYLDFMRKDAMHMLRLLYFCKEILTTGDLHLKCPTDLLKVRTGERSYKEVMQEAETLFVEIEQIKTDLPPAPNETFLNDVLSEIMDDYLQAMRDFNE